jgi:hypothetical protein
MFSNRDRYILEKSFADMSEKFREIDEREGRIIKKLNEHTQKISELECRILDSDDDK